jgi:uncharacterized membrane protein
MIDTIRHLDAHHRLFVSIVIAMLALYGLHGRIPVATQLVAAWDVYAIVYLMLAWFMIGRANPSVVRQNVKIQDSSRMVIFVLVIAAAWISLLAVGFVLGPSKTLVNNQRFVHIGLSIVAVICSWLLTHTVFAIHYAHVFYSDTIEETSRKRHGGLEFPGTKDPDYLDFVYFSYVIGMTFQVSDVQISSRRMRRYALIQALLAFAFNTIILALSVNIILNLI